MSKVAAIVMLSVVTGVAVGSTIDKVAIGQVRAPTGGLKVLIASIDGSQQSSVVGAMCDSVIALMHIPKGTTLPKIDVAVTCSTVLAAIAVAVAFVVAGEVAVAGAVAVTVARQDSDLQGTP